MLIVIAGLIGTGKSSIAKEVSKQLQIPSCSVDDDKEIIYKKSPRYKYFIENNIPFPDELRKQAFDATLKRLKKLAKTNKHVIIEETFHKKSLREPFFESAQKFFGEKIITQVTADEKVIEKRLNKRTTQGQHMVGFGMYLSFKEQWEPFDKIDYHFVNNDSLSKNLNKYITYLKDVFD